ncbi:tetratricopeptide repeat protein [Acidicapsa acidisoli]|uniref:tetratricopeptide repeat protein n=1 Tax=Acidicapsa acidisoli TaxID=1615681 RepID=UPI0021E0E646|nr:tetratricopeptide repeat protein [Acidicapsa acidisoli]
MKGFDGAILLWILLSASASHAQGTQANQASAANAETAPAVSLADAKALAAKGHLDQALAELNELAKAEPEEPGVERLRGIILYQKELLPEAEAAFRKAAAQDAQDRESKEMLGITLYRLGRPVEAIPLLEKAESTVSGANADPKYVLGLCYTDTKRYDDARRAFAAQFGFAPDSAEAYLVAARLFLRREFADEAAVFAHKAVELNSALPQAHQLLGEIALAKADLPLAVRELEAEQKLNPLDGAMYDRLGDAYVRNGQYEEARQALNKAVLLEPNATGPYILLGEALIKLGEPIQALHYLDRAASMDPGNYITHNVLGQAYRALGQMADANREYKLAVEIQHKNDPKPAQAR